MQTLGSTKGISSILYLGAHPDDIEIGCGGTVLKFLERVPDAAVTWVIFGAAEDRVAEAKEGAHRFLGRTPARLIVKRFRDGFFPAQLVEIKESFEDLRKEIDPDIILTHHRDDAHQDHRVICDLTWQTFRNHAILEYEIPKYDADLGHPNLFVELDSDMVERKIQYLMEVFASQRSKHWFSDETFRAILRLRGTECRAADGYAEAFHCRKMILG